MSTLEGMHIDFWLEGSLWFGMTMYPGYGGKTYHSPIHLEGFQLLDDDWFCLDFLNLGYAQGIQNFSIEFEIVRGTAEYQVCFARQQADRTYIFVPLTSDWKRAHTPHFANQIEFDANGVPIPRKASPEIQRCCAIGKHHTSYFRRAASRRDRR